MWVLRTDGSFVIITVLWGYFKFVFYTRGLGRRTFVIVYLGGVGFRFRLVDIWGC